MLHVSVATLTLVLSTFVPFLTGIVGKERSGAVRSVLNALLSATVGAVTLAIAQGGNVQLSGWILNIAIAIGASVVSYHGLLAPTGVIDRVVTFAANLLAKVGVKVPVQAVEVDVESILTRLEEMLQKQAATTNVTNVSSSGTGMSGEKVGGTP